MTETYRERKRKRDKERETFLALFSPPHHPFPGFKAVCLAFAYTSLAHICCYFPFFAVVYCLHAICEAFFCAFPLFVLLHLTPFLRWCYRASRDAGKWGANFLLHLASTRSSSLQPTLLNILKSTQRPCLPHPFPSSYNVHTHVQNIKKYKKHIKTFHPFLQAALASRCGQQQTTQALLHSSNLILPRNVVFFFSSYPTLQAPSPSPVTSTLHHTFFVATGLVLFCSSSAICHPTPKQAKRGNSNPQKESSSMAMAWPSELTVRFVPKLFCFSRPRRCRNAGRSFCFCSSPFLTFSSYSLVPWCVCGSVGFWNFSIPEVNSKPFSGAPGYEREGGSCSRPLTHSLTLALSLSFVHQGMLCVLLLLLLADLQFVSKSFP